MESKGLHASSESIPDNDVSTTNGEMSFQLLNNEVILVANAQPTHSELLIRGATENLPLVDSLSNEAVVQTDAEKKLTCDVTISGCNEIRVDLTNEQSLNEPVRGIYLASKYNRSLDFEPLIAFKEDQSEMDATLYNEVLNPEKFHEELQDKTLPHIKEDETPVEKIIDPAFLEESNSESIGVAVEQTLMDVVQDIYSSQNTHLLLNQPESMNIPAIQRSTEARLLSHLVMTDLEMVKLELVDEPFFLDKIFRRIGVVAIVGQPDTGKSQWLRQMAIMAVNGAHTFMGFEFHLRYFRGIFVTTEDGVESTRFLLVKQYDGLGFQASGGLRLLIADMLSPNEIVGKLKEMVNESQVDFIIIDGFGDMFNGKDLNNSVDMRSSVRYFDQLAKSLDCLVILAHHINKASYKQSPSMQHVQGGGGFIQRIRCVVQLTKGGGDIRYFSVLKGNYVSREYKDVAIELRFSEVDFLFTPTGKNVSIEQIGVKTTGTSDQSIPDNLEKVAQSVLGTDILLHHQFVDKYRNITGYSEPTAKRAIKKMLEQKIVRKSISGQYQMATFDEELTEDDSSPRI